MRLGVDFDNTIVCYDDVFQRVAVEAGLVPTDMEPSKERVRDHLRRSGRESDWTALQGEVYGPRMMEVTAYPCALDCLAAWVRAAVPTFIISHKTRFPYQGPRHDLHGAALGWLDRHGFFDSGAIALPRAHVFFELTKEDKLRRIAAVGCTHFIDDLPELLAEPAFPEGVERILFDPHGVHGTERRFRHVSSWAELAWIVPPGQVPS